MIRLGKSEEAQILLKGVQLEEPCEDATLQAMAICFRETHRRKEKINKLFGFMNHKHILDFILQLN